MPDDRIYYVFCEDNCRFESMTKEEILAKVEKITEAKMPLNVETITKQINEINKNRPFYFWIGTQAEYNAIEQIETDVIYIFSDDETKQQCLQEIASISRSFDNFEKRNKSQNDRIQKINENITALEEGNAIAKKIIQDVNQYIFQTNEKAVQGGNKVTVASTKLSSYYYSRESLTELFNNADGLNITQEPYPTNVQLQGSFNSNRNYIFTFDYAGILTQQILRPKGKSNNPNGFQNMVVKVYGLINNEIVERKIYIVENSQNRSKIIMEMIGEGSGVVKLKNITRIGEI